MEKVYDTTRISNLANDQKQFCSFFCEYIKRDDISIDIALDVLRISSIYYNRFSVQTEVEYNNTFKKCINEWICPYISRHLLSLNPLQARCRRYSRGER